MYDKHDDIWRGQLAEEGKLKPAHDYKSRWRHDRMYDRFLPFIRSGETWLTVGDGRYGKDGQYLESKGAIVHCTDLSDALLKIAFKNGEITSYSAENAEALRFPDSSFDYVFCKESLHHFPRPHVALHEMFRVCRKAVLLIEPRDTQIDVAPHQWVLNAANKLRRKKPAYEFEPVGNFLYRFSEREFEKFMLGMHERYIGFSGLNDAFYPDDHDGNKTRAKIRVMDALNKLGLRETQLICAALFKAEPQDEKGLTALDWTIRRLPKNPFRG